ncbi:MAG: hypothetical protein IKB82_08170 [Clostridia bacterium]|nr:hypothetical protein [Clostridia bacterium]MBR6653240.1 hypothetical protein [Oscillospiraceae bacterium]
MQKVQYISGSHEGELTEIITVDPTQIPAPVRDGLAAATLDMIYGILRQPGGREALDAKIAARKAAMTARGRG